jgi:hypothetical protein
MGKMEEKETIFFNGETININNDIVDDAIYAYFKKGSKEPVVSAVGRVIKDKYNVETHRDFMNAYDGFEGGRMYIVKEMVDGEDDPIVYKQIAPTIRDGSIILSKNKNEMLADNVIEDNYNNQNIIYAKNSRDYVEKMTEISRLEIEHLKSMLNESNGLIKSLQEENQKLRQDNYELRLKYENEIWKNQFVKDKEQEVEKMTEKELKKYQQTLSDNNTMSMIGSLIDKVAPILVEKWLSPTTNKNTQTAPATIPDVPVINEKDVQPTNINSNMEVYNGN